MSLYAADGSINITVVPGNAYTGLYAADGSINVVVSDGSSYVGAYHPCGALWVNSSVSELTLRAPDGSLYIQTYPYTQMGQEVTVVSGSLGGDSPPAYTPTYYFIGF